MANVLLLAILFWGIMYLIRRSRVKWLADAARVGIVLALLIPLNGLRTMAELNIGGLVLSKGVASVVATLLLGIVGMIIMLKWRRGMARLAAHLILILSPFVLVTFGQASWAIAKVPAQSEVTILDLAPDGTGPRVLWLIFDTLDQRIVFDERPESIDLPELDKFRKESLSASNAKSPNKETILSMPSLVTGALVKESVAISEGDLRITFQKDNSTVNWGDHPGIFSMVRETGVAMGVAGRWYHPYCKVFEYIDSCARGLPRENVDFGDSRKSEVALAMAQQLYRLQPWWGLLSNPLRVVFSTEGYRAIKIHQKTLENAKWLVKQPSLGFQFIHFSVPHDPYIFDRGRREYDVLPDGPEGYFGNLILADQALGELRSIMEDAGTWEESAIILSADHAWHTSSAYDSKVNVRGVPFLLKLPGQSEGVLYDKEFNTIITHDLILELLKEEISDYGSAARWLDARRAIEH